MIHAGVFLADGPSDLPLARHLEGLCSQLGAETTLTAVNPVLLRGVGLTVEARLRFLKERQIQCAVVFVHRDSESVNPEPRYLEIREAASSSGTTEPVVPVVPVRMTEAWLLLDEAEIRRVAARPNGSTPLFLPRRSEIERLADPKQRLAEALLAASETHGRKRDRFRRDFPRHRSLLIERLDITGPVSGLQAWRRLKDDVAKAIAILNEGRPT